MEPGAASDVVADELGELWPDLLRFSRSLSGNADLAQDIAQESLARALQREQGLDGVINLRAWLCQIAVNVFREWWRKSAREKEHLRQFATNHTGGTQILPEGMAEHREYLESIWRFIQRLPEIQRRVIELHLVEACSHNEIAARLNITTDNVKTNLSLVRRKLREKFLPVQEPKP